MCDTITSASLRHPTSPKGYIIVFDAGSSGTRVHIYNFLPHDSAAAVPKIDRCVNDIQTLKQKPGLSSIAEGFSPIQIPLEVSKALSPLLDFARGFVPEKQWPSTPLVLKATAGLRAVDPAKAARVIAAVAKIFRSSGFMFETNWASIIPGNEEGGLAWVTANYLAGTFEHEGPVTNNNDDSLGIIEMGGGSSQVSFRMYDLKAFEKLDQDKSRPKRQFKYTDLAGRRHNVYALSYLGFGQDHAKQRLSNYINIRYINQWKRTTGEKDFVGYDPCFRSSYKRTTGSHNQIQIKGSGNFQLCREHIKNVLFNISMPDQPPLIPGLQTHSGYAQPPLSGKFIATENFWYTRKSNDVVPSAELLLDDNYVNKLGERYCGTWGNNRMVEISDGSDGDGKPKKSIQFDVNNKYCFGLAFQSVFLEMLHANGPSLPKITKNIGGSDLDWAMGAAVVHFSTHDIELRKLWSNFGWELKIAGIRGKWSNTKGLGLSLFERPNTLVIILIIVIGAIYFLLRKSSGIPLLPIKNRRKSFVSVTKTSYASKNV
jgi:apyrase